MGLKSDKLTLGTKDASYCRLLKPGVKYSLFNEATWGHHKILIANDVGTVKYKFRIPLPFISGGDTRLRPFKGL